MSTKRTLIFVEQYIPKAIKVAREQFGDIDVVILRDIKRKTKDKDRTFTNADALIYVDYSVGWKISQALLPYQNSLLAITARGESGVNSLANVIPHVPYIDTPSPDSLRWATDKYEMRRRLKIYDEKNTPKFTKVANNTKTERDRVAKKIGFPMVIKPANLQESMLVTICYHEEEFEKSLRNIFRKLRNEYQKNHRTQMPTIMAEEFMDGDMYSIDSYVNSKGEVYHCPLVRVKTGRDIGHDDFYNYQQITPALLKPETIAKAEKVTKTAIHALGLRSTTVHTEMIKIDDEWKVIELGARIGGFRELLYELSCGIDHSLNDILIRTPKKLVIPKKINGYAAVLKWFAGKEGVITEMKGVKKIEQLESFHKIDMRKKIGDRATFARNGGKSIFNLFLYNKDRSKLLADIRRVEQMVKVRVLTRGKKAVSKVENDLVVEKNVVNKDKKKKT